MEYNENQSKVPIIRFNATEIIIGRWHLALCEKCPNTEFFQVRIGENTGQKKSVLGHF